MTKERNEKNVERATKNYNMSETELFTRISMLPEYEEKVLNTKWGLYDSKFCGTYRVLAKRLGLTYQCEAKAALSKARSLLMLASVFIIYPPKKQGYRMTKEDICYAILIENYVNSYNITESSMSFEEMKEIFKEKISKLKKLQKTAIEMRCGMKDGRKATLEETGITIGTTRDGVRQIEKKLMDLVRKDVLERDVKKNEE